MGYDNNEEFTSAPEVHGTTNAGACTANLYLHMPSPHFNVACRKVRVPGTRSHMKNVMKHNIVERLL